MEAAAITPVPSPTRSARRTSSTSLAHPIEVSEPQLELPRVSDAEERPQVSVHEHPKPLAPVVSDPYPRCVSSGGHHWNRTGSNGRSRRYHCTICNLLVKERKNGGMWEPNGTDYPGDLDAPIVQLADRASQGRSDAPDGAGGNVDEDRSLVDASAPDAGARRTRQWSSLAWSDAPSSLWGSSPSIRGLPAYPPAHHSRSCSSVTSATTLVEEFATPVSSLRNITPLVTDVRLPSPRVIATPVLVLDHPKPRKPMADHNLARCSSDSGEHNFVFKWAGGVQRHYYCTYCMVVLKEKKAGHPQIWVPAHTVTGRR